MVSALCNKECKSRETLHESGELTHPCPFQTMHRPLSSTSCWRLTLLLLVLVPVVEPTHQNGHDIIINGAGTRITTALYQKAAFAYRFVKTSVAVQYTPTGSGRSTCRLMSHEDRCSPTDVQEPLHVDFGASDSLLKNADYEQYPDLQMYPTVAIAAVPVFNLGAQAQLVLSMTALAKIFSGEIQVWGAPCTQPVVAENGLMVTFPEIHLARMFV